MNQKELLNFTPTQWRCLYEEKLPFLTEIADKASNPEEFKLMLSVYAARCMEKGNQAASRLKLLIQFDGREVHELSTGKLLSISTMSTLYAFLKNQKNGECTTDFLMDLFHQFARLQTSESNAAPAADIEALTRRWPTGLDKDVQSIRAENKELIIHALIDKLSHRENRVSRFHFEEGLDYRQKYGLVCEWWNDYRFQLAMAVKDPAELNRFLGHSLSSETVFLLSQAKKKGIPLFVTPYYLSLLNGTGRGYDDRSLRSYVFCSPALVETFGDIHAWEKEDMVEEGEPNAAGWLLPSGHNIHRRYPDVAILIPDTMGRSCGGLCASCQRMYDFQSQRLHFDLELLRPDESWDSKMNRLMDYFEEDSQLRDILITGGDALMSQTKVLKGILEAVCQMALRKRQANKGRAEGDKFAEIQRVRLGTRLPVYLPMRIDDGLASVLRDFVQKASAAGIRQFIIQTHFQTPLEMTPEAAESIARLQSAGWTIHNQLVFNVAASRRGHTNKLRQTLNRLGIMCYYTFSVKGFDENKEVFAPNSRSVQEQMEEKSLGQLSHDEADELAAQLIKGETDAPRNLQDFMRRHNLPFLATDRNVLNLPGIGKSMSFTTVGIASDGRRILCFDHDTTRRHSPIIDKMGKVYIVENKSVAHYLRQIHQMGEDVEAYGSIWHYTEGETGPRFKWFEYPPFDFRVTGEMTNLQIG